MRFAGDPRVDAYIDSLPEWQQEICREVREIVHRAVFLYDPLVPDPEGIITSGHENKTGRTVAIRRGEEINARALSEMFKAIIAHNRAGGWRRLA